MESSDADEQFKDFVRAQPRRQPEKFTSSMRTFLLSQVMESWAVVTDTRIDDRAVYNKRRVWASISSQFNQRFPHCHKTVQQLKDLWKRHSIQFRKESREEMALEDDGGPDSLGSMAVPNEVMFQKLLEWLESNPGGDDLDEMSPPSTVKDETDEPPRKLSRQLDDMPADSVKQEPASSPSSRANTPSAESACSAEDVAAALDASCRKSAEVLSSADKHYLIQRCFRAYDVIGSARLDSPALRQKRKTWVEICTEYNRKFGRSLGVSTVKGVWRRFVKQRKDDLMKTLKLRNKEDVTEQALMEDMKAFLTSYRLSGEQDDRQDLPLYKQIKADVEERPLTISHRSQQMSPEQIINQLRKLAPAPPPLRAADGAAAVRRRPTTPAEEPDEGLMSEEDVEESSVLDPRDRLWSDVSITVVDPESRPASGGPPPDATGASAPAISRAPPMAGGPAPAAPLAASAADAAGRLAREKHQIELLHMREQHQMALQQMREKHQWEMEKARLEAEILGMQRDYWRLRLERSRAGAGPPPGQLG
ncbi:uncharacterized protein LOC119111214 [Pollicipes pollicipes]|uniref:uncharacterized protein LOC119111214 n=1 Tax=Pollicipes pollicipes TaxID=41117 RepID=UPI001885A13A|nr:uncharacterized protein LOC119111214 [Pollicipes pollicipes]